ncbi:hypothetical protein cd3_030 [Carnobacterium phage cd3]|uniref:Uncharacterized protein n=2 Tax=Carnodivirus TaxID=3044682 RepID=A0AAE7SQT0_9CAUD|nr:hypothetical protein PQD68_gp030 [Carnobacterium phage cd2]YP_010676496.1 hypothetical protein PQD69_gp030 [Carnobacterium phage cd4]QXP45156.1 hypothetical protein cd2_030 [Carnobacterium phage cd2]QXP45288.1 hypothetical protein cd3_030 [Carnobacterium phage cd3]QXP45371.1 hypothetical protein cd4_030 [Carnobacterium phage cd4]
MRTSNRLEACTVPRNSLGSTPIKPIAVNTAPLQTYINLLLVASLLS